MNAIIVRLVTYDLPGFGQSDPHIGRNLNSSAMDMLYLANALNIPEKFWVVGYSGGGMHAWSALRYIPDRIAGTYFMVFLLHCFGFVSLYFGKLLRKGEGAAFVMFLAWGSD
jgi:pimeloyl-ACP methyl ester carboxylesterase